MAAPAGPATNGPNTMITLTESMITLATSLQRLTENNDELNSVLLYAREGKKLSTAILNAVPIQLPDLDELEATQSDFATLQVQYNEIKTQLEATLALASLAGTNTHTGHDHERTGRHPDAPMFSGKEPALLMSFLTQLRLKLAHHPDVYNTEQKMLRYAFSRLEGPALAQMIRFVQDDNTISLPTFNDWVGKLKLAYDDPDRFATAERELDSLKQGNRLFSLYYADFDRIMADLNLEGRHQITALRKGLSEEMKDFLQHRPVPTTLEGYVTLCQEVDQIIRTRRAEKLGQRMSNHMRAAPSAETATASQAAAAPAVGHNSHPTNTNSGDYGPAPMDLSANRRRITMEEKAARRAEGRCLYCGGFYHFASNCPNKPRPTQGGPQRGSSGAPPRRPTMRGAAANLGSAEAEAPASSQPAGNA